MTASIAPIPFSELEAERDGVIAAMMDDFLDLKGGGVVLNLTIHDLDPDIYPPELADAVVISMVLNLLPLRSAQQLMSHARRWLKPDGLLIVCAPNDLCKNRNLGTMYDWEMLKDVCGVGLNHVPEVPPIFFLGWRRC